MTRTRIPGLVCAFVLCGILVAGLAPFRRPRNAVTWLGNENGPRFGRYGTIWSSGEFAASTRNEPSCSLEIWLQPNLANASSSILGFYTPENPLQFSVHQYRASLILIRKNQADPPGTQLIGIANVLRPIKPAFITITSGPQKTSIYVDGSLVKPFPLFQIGADCVGQLVFGTSSIENDSWTGELRGLAIYKRELTPAEVLRHYETWTTRGRPAVSGDENAMRIYLFDEHREHSS